jgi:asparagine N-glycosylation enzyme membrane subunit Stt3
VSPLDPHAPPPGEEVHLPGPSILPLLTAVGITLALIGTTTYFELSIIGGVLTIVCIFRWVKDTRRDIDALPLDAHGEGGSHGA